MKRILFFITIMISFSAFSQENTLKINVADKGAAVPSSMYGVFFEEISHAGDGGLYAELLKNRSFEELEMPEGYHADGDKLIPKQNHNHITGKISNGTFQWTTEPVPGWSLQAAHFSAASISVSKENYKFETAPNNLKLAITDASKPVTLTNEGYWGIGVKKGEKYNLRAIFRQSSDYTGKITVKIVSENGEVLASKILAKAKEDQWNDIKLVLQSSGTSAKAKFVLEFDQKGTIWLDYVSLFPENTFNKRSNGLRNDVAGMIAGLKPSFMRWPGGCVVEGISVENRFEWKKTLGDPAARSGEYSTWGYRCSYGFGYYEYLQYCEDIKAEAMFVCSVGIGCQYRMGDACSEDKVEYYLQDCLDAIEYALGDKNTQWGAKRIASGHAKSFPLKYVEIGNENWGDEYDKRFQLFYDTIKKKYPQLTLISNHDLNSANKVAKTDMIDPHWYVAPGYFFNNSTIFDKQPRGKYEVYVGEYACNNGVGSGTMEAALSEAAFISGMERNSDLVTMASYAPLLENSNNRNWAVNLIWLNSNQVFGRSSYYVQKMAAWNKPTYNVKSNFTMTSPIKKEMLAGAFGFGTWETQSEYKEITITQNGTKTAVDLNTISGLTGDWNKNNGVLAQTSAKTGTKSILNGFSASEYTLEFKARKTGGKEGFLIYVGMSADHKEGFFFNVGGWNNSATAVERISNGNSAGAVNESVKHSVEVNKWYDVKVTVNRYGASLYMDGKLVSSFENSTNPLQFFGSGYDEKTGEIILKVVNASENSFSQNIELEGVSNVVAVGKAITLKSANAGDENTFANPKAIFPAESTFSDFGKKFSYNFSPFSYTILRIKASKEK